MKYKKGTFFGDGEILGQVCLERWWMSAPWQHSRPGWMGSKHPDIAEDASTHCVKLEYSEYSTRLPFKVLSNPNCSVTLINV